MTRGLGSVTGVDGLLGAGANAREITSYLPAPPTFHAVGRDYVDGAPAGAVDIVAPSAAQASSAVVATPGAPALRRALVAQWPGSTYATVVSEHAYVDTSCRIGAGTVVAPGVVISNDVRLGSHCQVNIAASISHDSTLGDFVTLAPGARLAGNVRLGDGTFIGMGAIVLQGVSIARGSVIGAGAVVLADVDAENSVLVGTPARLQRIEKDWLHDL